MLQQEISSAFTEYSIGEVLEDKALLNDYILVRPVEAIPGTTGQQVSNSLTVQSSGVDAKGNPYTSSTNTDNVIQAKWLRWGSQRITAPDVRRRMRVMIYRYADTDEYYWEDMGLDTQLKRLETVIWGINNNPVGDSESTESPANMHTVEFSSHTKQLTLRTSQANGEPAGYVMQFNLADGSFVVADTEGNTLNLDSMESHWLMRNSLGSFMSMEKNEVKIETAELVDFKTKHFHIKTDTMHVEANTIQYDANDITTNAKNITTKANNIETSASSIKTSCNSMNISASSGFHMSTPTATITGAVHVGSISTGASGGSGGATINGTTTVTGAIHGQSSMSLRGALTCVGVNSSANVNAPNIR